MIENAPVRSFVHKGLTVEGYSRAAVQSYWRIPELKLGFDLIERGVGRAEQRLSGLDVGAISAVVRPGALEARELLPP
jgi:hypothetical protein